MQEQGFLGGLRCQGAARCFHQRGDIYERSTGDDVVSPLAGRMTSKELALCLRRGQCVEAFEAGRTIAHGCARRWSSVQS